jgi:hypothetical protein
MSTARKIAEIPPWTCDLTAGVNPPGVDSSCIGVGEALTPEQMLQMVVDGNVEHVCQKSGHLFDKEMLSAETMVRSPESYLEFPAATILSPHDLNEAAEKKLLLVDQPFNCSSQKQVILTLVTDAMQAKGISQTIMDDVVAVADELFTNAIFNAPFVDKTTHINPGVSRSGLDITLENGKTGRLFLAHDESRLVIGCRDPFGSLELKRYMARILATYQQGAAATINFGSGGAGIGSYIIFNAGSSLYFGVWPGAATQLCCVVPLGVSNRKRIQFSKHVHWIQRGGGKP